MSKGGGVLVNPFGCPRVGCFSNFGRVDDVTRAMSKGGVLVVICVKFRANQPLCPPPPNQSVPIHLWIYPRAVPRDVDRVSVSVLYTETDATQCKFLVCPNKSSNHYKKPSPVHISGLNIVKHT